ncbi:MAG: hypothetical protein CM1200mP15_17470 [Dehalococcoidia bacterium]|nr:MAG: hypothetical protein CM1200mP15_17470 [Dehalococcoidia bacterium]
MCEGSVSSSTATCDFTVGNPPFIVGEGTDTTASGYTNAETIAGWGTDTNLVNAQDGLKQSGAVEQC